MFKGTIKDLKVFRGCIEGISELTDEVPVKVDPKEGLRILAMDPAHVALIDFKVQPDAFKDYSCKEGFNTTLDMEKFKSRLQSAKKTEELSLHIYSLQEGKKEKHIIELTFLEEIKRKFKIELIEDSFDEIKVPDLDFKAVVEINPQVFSDAIEDALLVQDHVYIKVTDEALIISAKSKDIEDNMETTIYKEACTKFEKKGKKDVISMFATEYLQDIVKPGEVADSVIISIGDTIPIKVEYKFSQAISLIYLLAPRIESE